MKAIVDQSLGDILDADTGLIAKDARVQDALMRNPAAFALDEHRIVG